MFCSFSFFPLSPLLPKPCLANPILLNPTYIPCIHTTHYEGQNWLRLFLLTFFYLCPILLCFSFISSFSLHQVVTMSLTNPRRIFGRLLSHIHPQVTKLCLMLMEWKLCRRVIIIWHLGDGWWYMVCTYSQTSYEETSLG